MKKMADYSIEINSKKKSSKFVSGLITFLVIGLLVFVGPVNALNLGLEGLRSSYNLGESINFLGKVGIRSNEIVNMKNVSLEVNGRVVCVFDAKGNELSSCDGINVELVSNNANRGYGYGYNQFNGSNGNYNGYGYGYGYGYGNGEITYNITIDTPQPYLWFGGNKIKLITTTSTQVLDSRAHYLTINPIIAGDGNFLFGYEDGSALFWGKYNSTDHSLVGEVRAVANSSVRYIGVGNYKPDNNHEGEWSVRFYDANQPHDVGIFWEGRYNSQNWELKYIANNSVVLRGQTYITPQ